MWRLRNLWVGLVLFGAVISAGEGDLLNQFGGLYEYENGTTIELAVSASDGQLYALLDGSLYLLRHQKGDRFLNVQDIPVTFVRGKKGQVVGYRIGESETVRKRLKKDLPNPAKRWFARLPSANGDFEYRYQKPQDLEDGIPVGDLSQTPLSESEVQSWMEAIVQGDYEQVHSILLVANGRLVLEEYFYEYDPAARHQMRSATKSVIGLLVGMALERGHLESLDQKVVSFFPEYELQNQSPSKNNITLRHLLTQMSGLACNDWDGDSPGHETKMGLSDDWVKFILDLPMEAEPGQKASYCSGGVILLGRIIEKTAGMPLPLFAEYHLFAPLGITDYRWRFVPDASSASTFNQLYLRPRDMVKLALLVSQGGLWQGKRIVPESWVTALSGHYSSIGYSDYGYLWWHKWLAIDGHRYEALTATGNGGQKIQIWEGLSLITVFTGGNYNRPTPVNAMLGKFVLPQWLNR